MNANLKYLLGGATFLLCAGGGYFVTKAIKGISVKSEPQPSGPIEVAVKTTDEVIKEDTLPSTTEDPHVPDNVVTEPVKIATVVKKTGSDYTLQVTCTNVPENVILRFEIPDLKMKNTDGYFIRIPGRKSGSYKVNVSNSVTGEILASKVVSGFAKVDEPVANLMTASEFQSLLLNQNDNSLLGGKHPKVAKSVSLSFEGLHDDDKRPNDILAVREKISFGIWSSAKVLRVGYDENGRINSARIQPIY